MYSYVEVAYALAWYVLIYFQQQSANKDFPAHSANASASGCE